MNQLRIFVEQATALPTIINILEQFPGQEELADIRKAPEVDQLDPDQKGIGLLRPLPNPNRSDIVMATANPFIEHSISHNIGVYVWGFYQVLELSHIGLFHNTLMRGSGCSTVVECTPAELTSRGLIPFGSWPLFFSFYP